MIEVLPFCIVTPAKTSPEDDGSKSSRALRRWHVRQRHWIPAFAGVTRLGDPPSEWSSHGQGILLQPTPPVEDDDDDDEDDKVKPGSGGNIDPDDDDGFSDDDDDDDDDETMWSVGAQSLR